MEIEGGVKQLQEQSSETVLWFPQLPSASHAQYQENDPTVMSSLCLMGGIEGSPQSSLGMKIPLSIIHMGEVVAWGGTEGPNQLTPLRSEALIGT